MVKDMVKRTRNDDPAKGVWNVYSNEATEWVDASSLVLGAIVEVDGNIIEDVCWLRKDDTTHINMSELDAVINGLNMGLKWKMNFLHICTDSKVVFYWVTDALTGKSKLRTKASNKILIRRRLQTITNIVDEYKLRVDIKLVPSESNLSDALTRVPGSWLKMVDKSPELVRVENNSNEDPEDDEELYVVLPEDETNKIPMLRRSTRERKAPDRYSP